MSEKRKMINIMEGNLLWNDSEIVLYRIYYREKEGATVKWLVDIMHLYASPTLTCRPIKERHKTHKGLLNLTC